MSLKMGFQPELRTHWLHECNADMDDSCIMAGNTTPVGVAVQAREEDLIRVGGGVRFSSWDSDVLSFGLDLDGGFGSDCEAYIVSGKLMHRFWIQRSTHGKSPPARRGLFCNAGLSAGENFIPLRT